MTSPLAEENLDETSSPRRQDTFLNIVALGNPGAGKSAVLNRLIGHPVLPMGENGATRAPIIIDLSGDGSLSSQAIILQNEDASQQFSAGYQTNHLQNRLNTGASGENPDEIYLKIRTSTCPPLKLIDLPGLDQRKVGDSKIAGYAQHNDAILLVIVPASEASEISSSGALKIAKEYDPERTRTVGIICKIDQAKENSEALASVQALLSNKGHPEATGIPWVALIGHSAQSESESLTAQFESESLKSILTEAPQSNLGRIALVNTLSSLIRRRMKLRLPNILSGLQGKSQIVKDELLRLGGQLLDSDDGTSAVAALEFEEKFLLHLAGGENGLAFLKTIVPGDVVTIRNDFAQISEDGAYILPLFQMAPIPLEGEDVRLISRSLEIGQTVTRIGRKAEDRGVIVAINNIVSITSREGDMDKIPVDELQRFREFFQGDVVFSAVEWLGVVRETELHISVKFEDGSKLSRADPDPTILKSVFTNRLEKSLKQRYYKGQKVRLDDVEGEVEGEVTRQKVDRVHVNWIDEKAKENFERPERVAAHLVHLLRPDVVVGKGWFSVGRRCKLNNEECLITKCHPRTVVVQWKGGNKQEEVDSREIVAEKGFPAFFEGKFQIGDIVVRRFFTKYITFVEYYGIVSGVNSEADVTVAWKNGTVSRVPRDHIDVVVPISDMDIHVLDEQVLEDSDENSDENSDEELNE